PPNEKKINKDILPTDPELVDLLRWMSTMFPYRDLPAPAHEFDDLDVSFWGFWPKWGFVVQKAPEFFGPATSFQLRNMFPGKDVSEAAKPFLRGAAEAIKPTTPLEALEWLSPIGIAMKMQRAVLTDIAKLASMFWRVKKETEDAKKLHDLM